MASPQRIGPSKPLPHSDEFANAEEYVDSILSFVGTHELLKTLCGGVHILDFFTSTPALYTQILPQEWRDFFAAYEVMDILDLLLRNPIPSPGAIAENWKNGPAPPESLLEYIRTVRKHLLQREPSGSQCSRNRAMKPTQKLARNVAVGMNVKKVHEVGLFASYVDKLTSALTSSDHGRISHLVDFGSGQNYLGRALASEPYNQHIVAIESRQANAERAKYFDVSAKLATKEKVMRNKKAFRAGLEGEEREQVPFNLPTPPSEVDVDGGTETGGFGQPTSSVELPSTGTGKIQYIEHRIQDGNLQEIVEMIPVPLGKERNLMVMSLHSCGNLVHHGLRAMMLNPEVKAVAMVGCCYNLLTERLGPATYKLPGLRPTTFDHPRLARTGEACDPHGFPMSSRLCEYYNGSADTKGVRLNISARMMAVQAPSNWGPKDSESFFTRHFYRALLQRIFLDRGVVGPPSPEYVGGISPAGHSSGGTPIVIGSLRKSCYNSFVDYVRGALTKLVKDSERGNLFKERTADIADAEIETYEQEYRERKKDLSVMWSLMAFSAGVIEATIVVDRYLWLTEQREVEEAWVEPVFDYNLSPRNLVLVGVKQTFAAAR